MAYRVVVERLSRDDGGGFAATVPELPGCRSDGDMPEEALANGYDAIGCGLKAAKEMGLSVPQSRQAAA